MNELPKFPVRHLPLRQKQVLVGISEGKSRKEVASELGVSVKTVDDHVMRMGRRLGSTNLAMLTRFALQFGYTTLCFLLLCLPVRAASVIIAWCPSADTNVTGYVVYYGPFTGGCTTNFGVFTFCPGVTITNTMSCGTYTNRLDVHNVTSTTITNLLNATTYAFSVTAYSTPGLESVASNTGLFKTAPPIPPAPTGFHVVP